MSPLELLSKLYNEEKTEDTVFIIGGGPSVSSILSDPSVLDSHDVIVTNNAYKLFPDAMLLHFADKVWWNWHQKPQHDVKNNFNGYISSATMHQRHHLDNNETRVVCFKNGNKKGGLTADKTKVDGCNTGHQAINIASHLDYKQIVLIGFDLNVDSKKTHWHSQHERQTNTDNFTRRMIPGFDRIADDSQKYDFEIFNLNHESAIKAFPFANLSDFI